MRWATGRQEQDMTGFRRRNQALARLMSASDATVSSSLRETALEVGERQAQPVRDIMVPWGQVVTLEASGNGESLRAMLASHPFLRYPLSDADGDSYVYYLDPLVEEEGRTLGSYGRPMVSLEPSLPLALALVRLEAAGSRLGLIREEGGPKIGIVAVRDLAEALLSLDSRL